MRTAQPGLAQRPRQLLRLYRQPYKQQSVLTPSSRAQSLPVDMLTPAPNTCCTYAAPFGCKIFCCKRRSGIHAGYVLSGKYPGSTCCMESLTPASSVYSKVTRRPVLSKNAAQSASSACSGYAFALRTCRDEYQRET